MAVIPRTLAFGAPSTEFSNQWTHPNDALSVLLILGGDVIQRALAQLTGGWLTPVTFSFGWVAYSVSALVSAAGDNKLLPLPDYPSCVINGQTGYSRDNKSWIIGRILRDFDVWKDSTVQEKLDEILLETDKALRAKIDPEEKAATRFQTAGTKEKVRKAGLCVSIYKLSFKHTAGEPVHDWIYYSGLIIALFQLGIAAIPLGVFGDWSILMTTMAGNLLAFISGGLSQWKDEKWACRKNNPKTVILTSGNGAQHAIVIKGDQSHGLNLEDLAAGPLAGGVSTSRTTRVVVCVLGFLWIVLLITVAGLKSNTWFLLAVGGLGMLHNVVIAGWPRRPENFGVHLEFESVIGKPKVMDTLYEVEERYPQIGRSMLKTFFPGELRPHEMKKWGEFKATVEERKNKISMVKKD